MDWGKAWKIIGVVGALANKYYDKIPQGELYGLINSVESKNKFKFYEHLYWVLRSIGEHKLVYEEESKELFELVDKLVDSDLSKEELAAVTPKISIKT